MIYNSEEDSKKIKMLDTIFNSVSTEELKTIMEAEKIVGRLKGEQVSDYGPISRIINELATLQNDNMTLQRELQTLREQVRLLVRCIDKGYGDYNTSNDFNNLKNQLGAY